MTTERPLSALQHFGLGTCGCKECDYYRKHPQLRPRELGGLSSTPLASNEQVFRCFFCKEDFRGVDAENHFGRREGSEPACKIKVPGEFALLQALRNAEDELNRFRAGDSDILRVLWSMRADHAAELRREEEKGYARGLRDARAESETTPEPWTALGDRLPEGEGYVLAAMLDGTVKTDLAWYVRGSFLADRERCVFTHWMPTPPPPSAEKSVAEPSGRIQKQEPLT